MMTTIDIAEDVLQAAEEMGRRDKKSPGEVISELARKGLATESGSGSAPEEFFGFRPFGSRGGVVTNEIINKLREDDIY